MCKMRSVLASIALGLVTSASADSPPAASWTQFWDPGDGTSATDGLVVATDDGEIFVATMSGQGGGDENIVLLKYTPDGQLLWTGIYDGPVNDTDTPTDLELTPEGISVVGAS